MKLWRPGQHLALKEPRLFQHGKHKEFTVPVRRVVVIEDVGGESINVYPVAHKTGREMSFGKWQYTTQRENVKGEWELTTTVKCCLRCSGVGLVSRDPLKVTERAIAAMGEIMSRINEPYCARKRSGCGSLNGKYVRTHYRGSWYAVTICGDCDRLRRNECTVRLRNQHKTGRVIALA